ncbi:biopolymer transport protein ExbD [Rhodobacter viridis]|uniref:Biopolymer transport protein ExbD n=1 Tax=Rhodobacter viridis TaxID=1054202 RepID=A0A318U384_9RHOB|nr:biopolymer transporter ExbD [Rhodobacter viridis]PYF09883.1 biopolymer transport protein ExbD [Rhodobacter viridis]
MLDPSGMKGRLPVSERRYAFTLMPLADAMMQLLIFFMLSASMSTYALLDLRAGPPPASGAAMVQALPDLIAGTDTEAGTLWTVESGAVIANGQRFGFDALGLMVAGLKRQQAPKVLLLVRRGASVQDLVVVLEALSAGGIGAVQLVSAEGG